MSEHDKPLADEDSPLGIRLRIRRCEDAHRRLEQKVDRIQWAIVAAAIGYLVSLWTGVGGGPG